jgi:hypothetical protein
MVEMATASAQRRGAIEMRLHAGPDCGAFFEALGFTPVVAVARWDAEPARRGHLPAVLAPEHSDVALDWLRQDDAFRRYPGLNPVFGRFLAGQGDSMYDLLRGVRHQAHRDGREHVRVMAPVDHPCRAEMEAAGFAISDDFRLTVYARSLVAGPSN